MKIGILTFHSQLNYGGVLQAYALQEVLCGMGHDVQIIDRWPDQENRSLELGYNKLGVLGWAKVVLRSLLGGWDLKKFRRVQDTKRFLRKYLHLTPYHFINWSDMNSSTSTLNYDLIIVGSDQVWRPGYYNDVGVYLLDGAPEVPAISYAASFGVSSIPKEYIAIYKKCLKRFSNLSCREKDGCRICFELGFMAEHVVDPTILLQPRIWKNEIKRSENKKQCIVCYFMDGEISAYERELERYARDHNITVKVFLDARFYCGIVKSFSDIFQRIRPAVVHEMISGGPVEFISEIANADMVITDSFHAIMFASIFKVNASFLRPKVGVRVGMVARINEFERSCVNGELIRDSVSEALEAFNNGVKINYKTDVIDALRKRSIAWLEKELEKLSKYESA